LRYFFAGIAFLEKKRPQFNVELNRFNFLIDKLLEDIEVASSKGDERTVEKLTAERQRIAKLKLRALGQYLNCDQQILTLKKQCESCAEKIEYFKSDLESLRASGHGPSAIPSSTEITPKH